MSGGDAEPGDSLPDAPFMGLCDFAMLPTGSQLAARLPA